LGEGTVLCIESRGEDVGHGLVVVSVAIPVLVLDGCYNCGGVDR
jgi:uncharacterized metal-binding protein